MVEPLEETRSELIFATEPILSSLELSIPGIGRRSPVVDLDEVEVRNNDSLVDVSQIDVFIYRFRKAFCKYAKDSLSYTRLLS